MSNKIVPTIYRAVIDDVISAIKPEFDEFGVAEEVLAELQHKWENKVIASHVAEFESPPPPPQVPSATHPAQQQHHFPPMHMMQNHPHYGATHNPYGATVKSEPVDSRYVLNPYSLPPLPGPNINGSRQLPVTLPLPHPGGQTGVISFPRNIQPQPASASTASTLARPYPPPTQRIPQVDGPSDSSGEDDSPPPTSAFAPRTAHPSLPQPPAPPQSQPTSLDSEAINSDLDDSDTEGEDEEDDGATGETDIVFCTYDKVARVKNKWKCTLKDGMIHVNGKDYLFAKCTGEFEW